MVTLLACEVVVRLFGWAPMLDRIDPDDPDSVYERSKNPLLGYVLKRSYRGENRHPGFRRTNAHGFRDVERGVERTPGVRRVIVLGDSVVAGHGLRDLEQTITRRAEALLKPVGSDGPRIEVLNFGVGGYCTRGEVELLAERGLAMRPDRVIVLFVENDWDDLNSEIGQLRHKSPRPRWVESMFLNSHLFRAVSLRLDWWRLRSDATGGGESPLLTPHMDAIGSDNVRGGLTRLAELSRRHGFDVRIAIWPSVTERGFVHRDRAGRSAPTGQLEVEQLAAELGLVATRLGPAMAAVATGSPGMYSKDGMHPTAAGAELAARALLPLLR